MRLKRLRFMAAALALLLALTACTGGDSTTGGASSGPPQGASATQSSSEAEQPPQPGGYLLPDANSINPLTGGARPEGLPDNARPVAIMVANNTEALPQRGVAAADVVYEILTEGGITRLMAVYADVAAIPDVGPVRSARDSFVQMAVDYEAMLVSIGASVYASNLIAALDYQTINGIYLGTTAFYFDAERHKTKANEYCWYTSAEKLAEGIAYTGIATTGAVTPLFGFDEKAKTGSEAAQNVQVHYSGASSASFEYDAASGLYGKNHNGSPHRDEDGSRLEYTNLFVLLCDTAMKVDGVSLDFALTEGTGYYFTGGTAQPITWEKESPDGQLRVYAADGSQLAVRPGKSYIGVLPTDRVNGLQYS